MRVTLEPAAAPPRGARTKKVALPRAARLLAACSDESASMMLPVASLTNASALEKAAPSKSAASSVVQSVPSTHTATTVRVSCASVSLSACSDRSPQTAVDAATVAEQRGAHVRSTGAGETAR